jgi:hypothetical protein
MWSRVINQKRKNEEKRKKKKRKVELVVRKEIRN